MTPKETKRQEIRRSAYSCFREHGYPLTTVDMICKTAGISKGSFYWTFSSKQEVFVDILTTWTDEVMDEIHEQFRAAGRSDDYVAAITHALERELRRGRAIVPIWIEFAAQAPREPEVQAALSRFYARIRTAVAEMLRPILGEALAEDELAAVAAAVFATFTGLVMQDLADPQEDADSMMARFMGALDLWTRHTVRRAAKDA